VCIAGAGYITSLSPNISLRYTIRYLFNDMAPLRSRDVRISSPTNPAAERRVARGLTINVSLANNPSDMRDLPAIDELELAFAAKEVELSSLLSPVDKSTLSTLSPWVPQKTTLLFQSPFPEIINSFNSFSAMRDVFLPYLAQNNILYLIPESKLYRAVYFPYG
jgi:hypothetical protein